jgi:hypothetical protein
LTLPEAPFDDTNVWGTDNWFKDRLRKAGKALLDLSKFTGIVFAVLMVAVIVAMFAVAGYYFLIAQPEEAPPFKQSYYKAIKNPMNTSQTFFLTVNLFSSTFGAQSEVTTYVTLAPNDDERQFYAQANYTIPEMYMIWFDGTYCQDSPNPYVRIHSCFLQLSREPKQDANWWNVHWLGDKVLNYAAGSVFDVALGNETSQEDQRIRTGSPFINIEGVEATNSFKSSQQSNLLQTRSLGTAYIGIAASIMTAYISALALVTASRRNRTNK